MAILALADLQPLEHADQRQGCFHGVSVPL
jgi:hypothetical protein